MDLLRAGSIALIGILSFALTFFANVYSFNTFGKSSEIVLSSFLLISFLPSFFIPFEIATKRPPSLKINTLVLCLVVSFIINLMLEKKWKGILTYSSLSFIILYGYTIFLQNNFLRDIGSKIAGISLVRAISLYVIIGFLTLSLEGGMFFKTVVLGLSIYLASNMIINSSEYVRKLLLGAVVGAIFLRFLIVTLDLSANTLFLNNLAQVAIGIMFPLVYGVTVKYGDIAALLLALIIGVGLCLIYKIALIINSIVFFMPHNFLFIDIALYTIFVVIELAGGAIATNHLKYHEKKDVRYIFLKYSLIMAISFLLLIQTHSYEKYLPIYLSLGGLYWICTFLLSSKRDKPF
jgi:hypothetical protein